MASTSSFLAVGWIKREVDEARRYLIGVILEDRDADKILEYLDELRAKVIACRRNPMPPP